MKSNNILDDIYKDTYKMNSVYKKDSAIIHKKVDKEINDIVNNNRDTNGDFSVSNLFNNKDNGSIDNLEKLFKSDDVNVLLSNYRENNSIKIIDKEIDTILNYVPSLQDAINVIKDNILSSENDRDSSLSFVINGNEKENENILKRINKIKNIHKLDDKFEDIVDNVLKYGEAFVAKFDFNTMNKYIKSSNKMKIKLNSDEIPKVNKISKISEDISIEINIGDYNILDQDMSIMNKLNNNLNEFGEIDIENQSLLNEDSLISLNDNDYYEKININGCYSKILDRDKVIPLYIENDIFCGALYIEGNKNNNPSHNIGFTSLFNKYKTIESNKQNQTLFMNNVLNKLSSKILDNIDKKFIKKNKNLSKEIFLLLKYNYENDKSSKDIFNITYIKPEDIQHFYINKDLKTNRGISLIDKSILPGKLYSALYIGTVIGVLTRGFDKRAYYINQDVEKNVGMILQDTANQLKKGNFGLNEFNNVNNVLNIPGRYNDILIPVNGGGQKAFDVEIISGQNIEIKSELLDILEFLALAPTGVPTEYISVRQDVEFAKRYSMTNMKFYRKISKIIKKLNIPTSNFVMKLYRSHYPDDNTNFESKLSIIPYLVIRTLLESFQDVNQLVEQLANNEYNDNDDPNEINLFKKYIFKQLMPTNLLSYVDKAKEYAKIENIKNNDTE